jgi:MFS family permease
VTAPPKDAPVTRTRKELFQVLGGLLLALFAAFLTGTVVTVALPVTVAELGGSQLEYNWIVTAMGLTATATSPVWGRVADSFDKKKLMLLCLGVFGLASIACALAQDSLQLIVARGVQGIGVGGIQTLVLVVIAALLPPRERVKYNGVYSAVVAVATVSGPLIGGILTDLPGVGWRYTYWFGVPFCVVAFFVLLFKLDLSSVEIRSSKPGVLAPTFIIAGISGILAWLSFAGVAFEWISPVSALVLFASLAVFGVGIAFDIRATGSVITWSLLRRRDTLLVIIAALSLGLTMQAAGVFLAQYLQIGIGLSALIAGLVTIPSSFATLLASTLSGRWSSRTGLLKAPLVLGMAFILAGNVVLSFLSPDTPLWVVIGALVLSGAGVGMSMQNTLVAIQNSVEQSEIGAASGTLGFLRSMGGTVGFQVLGALFAAHLASSVIGATTAAREPLPDEPTVLATLTATGQEALRHAYAADTHLLYLVAAIGSAIGLLALIFLRPIHLRDGSEQTARPPLEPDPALPQGDAP